MVTVRVARLCEQLWQESGADERFPRDPQALFAWTLPLGVFTLPALWADDAARWLRARGIEASTGPQRRLRACLVARGDGGVVLLDGRDPPDEHRFSLAHEAGHFLLDYHLPRRAAVAALGPSVAPVLDGKRLPTVSERVDALLHGRGLRLHLHLMERGSDGAACGAAAEAECLADAFALELLAPEAAVLSRLASLEPHAPYTQREQAAATLVRTHFGLPDPIAGRYARHLLWQQTGGRSTREWLGFGVRQ